MTGLNSSAQTWMDETEERIEEIRKGNFNFIVYDSLGNVFSEQANIYMTKHEFPWGSVALVPGSDYSDWGLATLAQYFNYGVWGNDFKWPWIEPDEGVLTYDDVDATLDWAEENGVRMRGHTLIWGGDESWQMPDWTLEASLSAKDLTDACETHIKRDVAYFKGRMADYDVINEPVHETWLADKVGDSINWNAFKWAKETDPDARMYVNDFNILVWESADIYVALVQEMLDNGAPIDGIGVQGHFENEINWEEIKTKLDKVAALDLPVRITEFDMKVNEFNISERKMAEDYARMMHIAFSHPSVDGFILWALCDNFAWRPGSGIFDENFMPKPAADTMLNLIHEHWSTNLLDQTASNDTFSFRGFYGDYSVTIDFGNGNIRSYSIPAHSVNQDSTFVLEYSSSIPVAPKLISASVNKKGDKIELLFDRALNSEMSSDGLNLYSADEIGVTAINLTNDSTIELSIDSDIAPRQFIGTYYTGDTIKGLNGTIAGLFGPVTVNNPLPFFISAETDTSGTIVFVSFSDQMMETVPEVQFTLTANDVEVNLTNAYLNTDNPKEIVLVPASPIETGKELRLSYEENNSFGNIDDYLLKSFGPKYALNNVKDGSTNIKDNKNNATVLYPNPVKNKLLISNISIYNKLDIYDVNGRRLYNKSINGQASLEINTKEFPQGNLFLKFTNSNGNSSVHKIIKQ